MGSRRREDNTEKGGCKGWRGWIGEKKTVIQKEEVERGQCWRKGGEVGIEEE